MEYRHGRSRPDLFRRRQQSLCLSCTRCAYTHTYAHSDSHIYSNTYSYCYTHADACGIAHSDSHGYSFTNTNADTIRHSDTLHGACGSERTSRNQCNF